MNPIQVIGKITSTIVSFILLPLNPIFSAALLLLLTYAPDPTRAHIHHHIIQQGLSVAHVKCALQVIFAIGMVRFINKKLNVLASNNWRFGGAPGWDWPNEVCVITGGSSGIGLGVVERLVRRSIKVAVFDIQPIPAKLQGNPLVHYYKCDVTSTQSIAEASDAVRKDLGNPTILINNAGIARVTPILEIDQEWVHKIFSINTMSHWSTVKQFAPAMVAANKGHIVNIASISSFVALPGSADYSCTKASALAFHEALSAELAVFHKAPNVLCSIIHPNFVDTPLIKDFMPGLAHGGVTFLAADHVSEEIVKQIYRKQGAQVSIPAMSGILGGMRGWPTWIQVLIRDGAAKGSSIIADHIAGKITLKKV